VHTKTMPSAQSLPHGAPGAPARTLPDRIRGMTREWDCSGLDPDSADPHADGRLVDRVLAARGYDDPGRAAALLNPSMTMLHDPSGIPDLDRAARRILDAVERHEPVVVFGDYDVDGVTGSAILIHTIRAIRPDARVSSYIPHRLDEGYGISAGAVRSIAQDGASLIVSVDCGITAVEPAQVAREEGIDLVITDHHTPPTALGEMPDAYAVVHPRRPDSSYPFGELCGAGVAFKLAWRLSTMHCGSERVTDSLRATLMEMLGFAALGTIADVVPLVDENRVIARFGLPLIRRTRIEGLAALIDASGLGSDRIDADDVGFRLAPRLNAIGRLGHAREALELMTDATGDRARELAERLSALNEDRRATERRIVDQARSMAEDESMTGDATRAIVLRHDGWHPGVVGIVCSRLVEAFARPVILMRDEDGVCRGSGRSIEGYDLHDALGACAEHLTSFGGHAMAAGLACDSSSFGAFRDALVAHANAVLTPGDLVRRVRPDAAARVDELTPDQVGSIETLAPFGAGHPRVRIVLQGVRLESTPEPFGRSGDHASLHVRDPGGTGVVRVIGWRWFERIRELRAGSRLDLVVEPKRSSWRDRVRVEPELVDLRVLSS